MDRWIIRATRQPDYGFVKNTVRDSLSKFLYEQTNGGR